MNLGIIQYTWAKDKERQTRRKEDHYILCRPVTGLDDRAKLELHALVLKWSRLSSRSKDNGSTLPGVSMNINNIVFLIRYISDSLHTNPMPSSTPRGDLDAKG
jgi:hypothetical protein